MKGGYNAWEDAGYPISYQKDGITFIQGRSIFDLIDPIKLEAGKKITIEGYHSRDMVFFISSTDANQVFFSYINLKGEYKPGQGYIARVSGNIIRIRGKIIQVSAQGRIGDMEIDTYELIREDIDDIIEVVDAHWENLSQELLKEKDSSYPDGAVGYPLFDQRTDEVILYRNVGNMQKVPSGEAYYVPEVNVYYFVNLDGKITKIFLEYRQLK